MASFIAKFQNALGSKGPEEEPAAIAVSHAANDKEREAGAAPEDTKPEQQVPSEDVQHGVKLAQALTLTWDTKSLVAVFILIWFLYLTNGFQSSILYNLTAYAASDFEAHSLIPVIGVVSGAFTAAVYIPLAKILDLWGRAEGFLVMMTFATLGMIMMAASHNIYTYCAATVFWELGWSGLIYSVDVITADSTKLRNRGLAYAFTSSPYMITTFAGAEAAEAFLEKVSWRWGFGAFSIILPIVTLPLYGILKWNIHKAKKNGTLVLVGVLLFVCGLTTFLLPFTIASTAHNGWKQDYIIAMIVVGFIVLVLFALNELFLAPQPFFKFKFLSDRTVMGACLLDIAYMISNYCWSSYFPSFLQVVNDQSVSKAGYISNIFQVVSGGLLIIVGLLISKTGRFKWLLWVGVPLYTLFQGLMIHFRQPGQSIGYVVMCQVFLSIGGSVFILCMQISILAAVDHQHVATALAVLSVCGNIGWAMGNTISAAIWTNTFEKALERYLPESALESIADIYIDLEVQLSYPVGSPERLGIQQAYGYAQARMLASGTAIMIFAFIAVAMIRNYDLKKMVQTKGRLF
ncbi:hypothetical protein ACJ41O_012800 [Fusarium nematophilum]